MEPLAVLLQLLLLLLSPSTSSSSLMFVLTLHPSLRYSVALN
jgi:hypothetical protein